MSINLKISNRPSSFKFICDVATVHKTLDKVMTVTNYSSSDSKDKHHLIISDDQQLYVLGYTPETFCVCVVPEAKVSGKGVFCFAPEVLKGITKNRHAMQFMFNKSRVTASQVKGNYKCDFITQPLSKDQVPNINRMLGGTRDKSSKLSTEVIASISQGVKTTLINNVYMPEEKMLAYVAVTKKAVVVSSYDDYHLAIYQHDMKNHNSCKIAMPSAAFTLLDKFVEEQGYADFFITETGLRVEYDSFIVALPPVQADSESFTLVNDLIGALGDKPDAKFVTSDELVNTVQNSSVLFTHGISSPATLSQLINVKIKKKLVSLTMDTVNGKAVNAFKIDKCVMKSNEVEFNVEPILMLDLISKCNAPIVRLSVFHKNPNIPAACFKMDYKLSHDIKVSLISTLKG